jgi:hypothetical protein
MARSQVRRALAFAVLVLVSPAFALAQGGPPATSAPPAPAAKAKWIAPVKGIAEIGYLKPTTKVVGDEVITKIKVKNLSTGAIALLRVDEYWYDKAGNMLPGDTQRWKKPFNPGEVIEIELRVPKNPKFYQNTYKFTHANGQCKPKQMDSFEAKKK